MGSENVIVSQDVTVTQAFRGLGVIADSLWIIAEFCLWKYDSNFHQIHPPICQNSMSDSYQNTAMIPAVGKVISPWRNTLIQEVPKVMQNV
jgi:hypothetical protein